MRGTEAGDGLDDNVLRVVDKFFMTIPSFVGIERRGSLAPGTQPCSLHNLRAAAVLGKRQVTP
ncbi:hypothetical protein [Cryobacterium sp. PAMC25264]|uniref:hypothetical protein n=1 Tax=Cryobacterium sp. PAMC25264 TaxID=2861288 RepID=UPI001C625537|nr:hypothetical protein [Cryobacterium sp. PAMC25264]QYF74850.1 hypothetical protein KY500_06830 [Cryobacterium sp. PAMC25264]